MPREQVMWAAVSCGNAADAEAAGASLKCVRSLISGAPLLRTVGGLPAMWHGLEPRSTAGLRAHGYILHTNRRLAAPVISLPEMRYQNTASRGSPFSAWGRFRYFCFGPLPGLLEPLQRFEDLGLARHRGVALFFFFLDDFFRRVGDEFLVAELGVDPFDVGIGLCQFLVEPHLLGRKVDHAFQRQRRHLAAHQQL